MQPVDVESIDVEEPKNWFTEMKNHKVTKPNPKGQRSVSNAVAAPEISTTCGDVMKKDLKISCSLCQNSLGLAENNYIVPCSLMSLSKVHLTSIWKGRLDKPTKGRTSVPVVVSDISLADRRIWDRIPEGATGQGIWSKEDGCVFNTTLCPFCRNPNNCLGLHVVATDSSNVQFLNKVLFYSDRLDIQHIDASRKKISPPPIVRANFDKVLVRQRPTVSKKDLELHERFTKEFGEALVKRAEKARKSVIASSHSL